MEHIRTLVERWLAGETSLSEEAALREFFAEQNAENNAEEKELPADLQPYRLMFGQSAGAVGERSSRKLVLRTEPHRTTSRPLRRWIAVASAVAAVMIGVVVFMTAPRDSHGGDILCVVNGEKITDPDLVAHYTREALEIASDNLNKPGQTLSSELGDDPAMTRVGEMLNELTKNQ